ncbi:MAG TPA: MipA/OmpV family protein [Burkholderiaceae bacterium]|nr:MipA/OmpV family protein [Burkholderiaceae bacterium]
MPLRSAPVRLVPAALAACLSVASPAFAQFQGVVSLPPVGPGDSRLLGGAALLVRPVYAGSDDWVATLLPYVDYAHRNGFFAGTGTGIGWSFVNTPSTQIGLRLVPRFGRYERDSDDLRGLGDISTTVEGGAYWTQSLSPAWTVGASVRGGSRGTELDAGARRDLQLGPATRLAVGGYATLANGRSQRTWYGIDANQAALSGYAPYEASSGLRGVSATASINHFFGGRWLAVGGIGVGRLLGDAADSPLVRDRTSVGGFAAIGYRFF